MNMTMKNEEKPLLLVKEGVAGHYLGADKTIFKPAYANLISTKIYFEQNSFVNVYADIRYYKDQEAKNPIRMADGTNERHLLLLQFQKTSDINENLVSNIESIIENMKP